MSSVPINYQNGQILFLSFHGCSLEVNGVPLPLKVETRNEDLEPFLDDDDDDDDFNQGRHMSHDDNDEDGGEDEEYTNNPPPPLSPARTTPNKTRGLSISTPIAKKRISPASRAFRPRSLHLKRTIAPLPVEVKKEKEHGSIPDSVSDSDGELQ
jgi:hypothetical protein